MTPRQRRPIRARSVQGNLQTPDPPRDAFPFRIRIVHDGGRTVSERFGKPEEVAKHIAAVWTLSLRRKIEGSWKIEIWGRDNDGWRDLNHEETWLMKTLIEGMGGTL